MYKDIVVMSTLHMAGCTSRDFQRFSELGKNEIQIYEDMTVGNSDNYTDWISTERWLKIRSKLKNIRTEEIENSLRKNNIHVILYGTDDYPARLARLQRFPYILYIRGKLQDAKLSLAIVGSRKSTTYGHRTLESIIPGLVSAGVSIVSGGAYGIDSIAHEKTLAYGGYTICVFGNSLDFYYPEKNFQLFEKIMACGGALVSPFALGTEAESYLFPQRNEIVAGLSDGVIIPEAGEKSGTLITAHLALEQGKDVFCFPGDIFRPTSHGTNMLIQKGEAKSIRCTNDILEEYLPSKEITSTELKEFTTKEENDIYKSINLGYDRPEDIASFLDYSVDSVLQTISLLEIGGHIETSREGRYISC